jgi:hypothetical protein
MWFTGVPTATAASAVATSRGDWLHPIFFIGAFVKSTLENTRSRRIPF